MCHEQLQDRFAYGRASPKPLTLNETTMTRERSMLNRAWLQRLGLSLVAGKGG
jgi:hypothetical protein